MTDPPVEILCQCGNNSLQISNTSSQKKNCLHKSSVRKDFMVRCKRSMARRLTTVLMILKRSYGIREIQPNSKYQKQNEADLQHSLKVEPPNVLQSQTHLEDRKKTNSLNG